MAMQSVQAPGRKDGAPTREAAGQPGVRRGRWYRGGIVLLGLVLSQAIIIGPSLLGMRILLPLDRVPLLINGPGPVQQAPVLADLVDQYGLYEFTAREYHHGRWPLWNPHNFAGIPLATVPKYSVLYLPFWLLPVPQALAYVVLFKSVVAGLGAYLFFRRVVKVGFWPAAVGAWCYPLTGFFIFWQGFPLTGAVAWLPWLLLAADATARRPGGWGGLSLAACTALVLLSGQLDIAGQVLLVCGLFFLWGLGEAGVKSFRVARAGGAVLAASAGWALGFAVAMPYLLPLLEYGRTGVRIEARAQGVEERPPEGLQALPEVLLPYSKGVYRKDWVRFGAGNELEGAGAAYVGLLAAVVVAPLAWASSRHRRLNTFWACLIVLGLSWQLDLPLLVDLLRLPGLNMMSHNRLTFAASFALLALAVTGLEVLFAGGPGWARWCYLGGAVAAVLGLGFLSCAVDLPEGLTLVGASDLARSNLRKVYVTGALLCGLALALWLALARRAALPRWFGALVGGLLVGELLVFAWGVNPQSSPEQLFPPIPIVSKLRRQYPPGRVFGVGCLLPDVNLVYGWDDVRGYDGVDPRQLRDVLEPVRQQDTPRVNYALMQFFIPELRVKAGEVRCPAVLSMLHVRYFIYADPPQPSDRPLLQDESHWVLQNPEAVDRVFVPSRVIGVPAGRTPALLAAANFDRNFNPRQVAFVEQRLDLPAECAGTAQIVEEVPTRLVVEADMKTPGLLVLADQWYEGWQAYRDGTPVPILRTNHLLRGVVLPAGQSRVEFRYEPASLALGLRLLSAAAVGAGIWAAAVYWVSRRTARTGAPSTSAVEAR
jgi:hypothetical protein